MAWESFGEQTSELGYVCALSKDIVISRDDVLGVDSIVSSVIDSSID